MPRSLLRLTIVLAGLVSVPTTTSASAADSTPKPTPIQIPLNITAISSRNGYSVLECWQLATVPVEAMSAANYALGDTTAATWSVIEPRTTVGEAWAPAVQYVYFYLTYLGAIRCLM